ncbi:MAG: DUF493 family protein [Rhodothermales bacterium]|nr:DUF493 family protein [Rhodothermales bacterium]
MQQPPQQNQEWWDRFQALLDEKVAWPNEYMFKFIVPSAGVDDVRALFGQEQPIELRPSSKGNYVSVTTLIRVATSAEVIDVYTRAARIEKIILL